MIGDRAIKTPDGRNIVVEGKAGPRLWRASNPALSEAQRETWVGRLMEARRAVRAARGDPQATAAARRDADAVKRALGERGPVWWDDGEPDLSRRFVRNTAYRDWWLASQWG